MTLNSDDIQKYTRIAFQYLAAYLMTHGMVDPAATWVQPAIGLAVAVATFLWTLYGSRISAKLASVEAIPGVHLVVDPTKAPQQAITAANDDDRPKIQLAA